MTTARTPRWFITFQLTMWGLVLGAVAYFLVPAYLPAPVAAATSLGPGVALDGPFRLVNEDGQPMTEADFAGKPGVWFYGFMNCPDVCPTALAEIGTLMGQLGSDADKLNAVFVTVDPERDTPELMKAYVDYFDPRIIGLTGDLDEITRMTAARFVAFEKVPYEDGGYAMQHPATIYLVRADGTFAGTLDAEEGMEVKLQKLQKLVGG